MSTLGGVPIQPNSLPSSDDVGSGVGFGSNVGYGVRPTSRPGDELGDGSGVVSLFKSGVRSGVVSCDMPCIRSGLGCSGYGIGSCRSGIGHGEGPMKGLEKGVRSQRPIRTIESNFPLGP